MTQALLIVLLGAMLVVLVVVAFRVSERQLHRPAPSPDPIIPPGVVNVLSLLRSRALVIDSDDHVVRSSAAAHALGLVQEHRVTLPRLAEMVSEVRRTGEILEDELSIRAEKGAPRLVGARVAPLLTDLVLVLLEDRTRERQLEAVRRDFVANVSHELKTPVGAIRLLAEAVLDAADDPEAVQRFAHRMHRESDRLTGLVQQIIELSRLQGDESPDNPVPVDVDKILTSAVDEIEIDAQARDIEVLCGGEPGLSVLGSKEQIALAVGNLVANAVTYSPPGSRVVVTARPAGEYVEIRVTDQGIGIPAGELDRIFERFYRVDPSRERTTGGTGLGLSIVKHVAASHGGDVAVWSVEGQGSTFTLSLPRAEEHL